MNLFSETKSEIIDGMNGKQRRRSHKFIGVPSSSSRAFASRALCFPTPARRVYCFIRLVRAGTSQIMPNKIVDALSASASQ